MPACRRPAPEEPTLTPPSPQSPPRRGQGLTEYILIVALVAIAAIGVVTLFGNNLRKLFGQSADALAGNAEVANDADARKPELETKQLDDYGEHNAY